MTEECGESSVAISSSTNWWENIHGGSGSTWAWQNHGNNPSSGSCEDDVSISNSCNTNSSFHSGLTIDSSHRLLNPLATELMLREHNSDNQLWSRMLLGIGNTGENYVDSLSSSSKSMSSYFIGSGDHHHHHNDRLIMQPSLSDNYRRSSPVNEWSIAPPISEVNYLSLDSPSGGLYPSDGYHKQYSDLKAESEKGYGGFQDNGWCHYGRFDDDSMFVDESLNHTGILGQHHRATNNKRGWKSTVSHHNCKKNGAVPPPPHVSSSSSVRTSNIKGQAITNSVSKKKKKPSEDNSESTSIAKKHKQESSTTSAARITKAKVGDRITTLQQIVSPFGKTDTSSVLMETVVYIKFLQRQVRLLISNPNLMVNPHKDLWGGLDRKERLDARVVELRSKGLCLVPVSCMPQVCRDNTGSDYWTPPHRSLLYRQKTL